MSTKPEPNAEQTTSAAHPIFTAFEVTDNGPDNPHCHGYRYMVEAIECDPEDTGKCAIVHIASCFSKDTAELIRAAMVAAHLAH